MLKKTNSIVIILLLIGGIYACKSKKTNKVEVKEPTPKTTEKKEEVLDKPMLYYTAPPSENNPDMIAVPQDSLFNPNINPNIPNIIVPNHNNPSQNDRALDSIKASQNEKKRKKQQK